MAGAHPQALDEDILAAVRFLRVRGATRISVLGASMGGGAAAKAAIAAKEGEIDQLILLSPVPVSEPQRIKTGDTVVIASQGESLWSTIQSQFQRIAETEKVNCDRWQCPCSTHFRKPTGSQAHSNYYRYSQRLKRLRRKLFRDLPVTVKLATIYSTSSSKSQVTSNHMTLMMPKAQANPTPKIQVKYHMFSLPWA